MATKWPLYAADLLEGISDRKKYAVFLFFAGTDAQAHEHREYLAASLSVLRNGSDICVVRSWVGGAGLRVKIYGGYGPTNPSSPLRDIGYHGTTGVAGLAASYPLIRQRQLTLDLAASFDVIESRVPEQHTPGESPRDYALRMARDKARAVSSRFPDAIVIGADTIVVCDAQILEKPADVTDARRMLAMLSSRTHTVVTAFALARGGNILESAPIESQVTFRKLTDAEIDAYIATDEPFDKAGAYGIQGIGGGFISHVEGSRDNVMGLPTERVVAALARHGVRRG